MNKAGHYDMPVTVIGSAYPCSLLLNFSLNEFTSLELDDSLCRIIRSAICHTMRYRYYIIFKRFETIQSSEHPNFTYFLINV